MTLVNLTWTVVDSGPGRQPGTQSGTRREKEGCDTRGMGDARYTYTCLVYKTKEKPRDLNRGTH